MNKIILPDNHCFLNFAKDVADICLPLFKQYKVNVFVYGRYYDNGKSYLLTNRRDWLQYHLKMGYTVPAPVPKELLAKKESYHIILDKGLFSQAKRDLLLMFNTNQAIDLIYKCKNYYEVFCFSFPVEVYDAINIFFNNINSFKKFCLFFKDKAEKIIRQAESNSIVLSDGMRGIDAKKILNSTAPLGELEFNEATGIKNYILNTQMGEIKFTSAEMKCLAYLLTGYSIQETSRLLTLSPRTLESYLDNVKNKLGCNKKTEIVNILFEFNFLSEVIQKI